MYMHIHTHKNVNIYNYMKILHPEHPQLLIFRKKHCLTMHKSDTCCNDVSSLADPFKSSKLTLATPQNKSRIKTTTTNVGSVDSIPLH